MTNKERASRPPDKVKNVTKRCTFIRPNGERCLIKQKRSYMQQILIHEDCTGRVIWGFLCTTHRRKPIEQ